MKTFKKTNSSKLKFFIISSVSKKAADLKITINNLLCGYGCKNLCKKKWGYPFNMPTTASSKLLLYFARTLYMELNLTQD